jgi:hypothetical protein
MQCGLTAKPWRIETRNQGQAGRTDPNGLKGTAVGWNRFPLSCYAS